MGQGQGVQVGTGVRAGGARAGEGLGHSLGGGGEGAYAVGGSAGGWRAGGVSCTGCSWLAGGWRAVSCTGCVWVGGGMGGGLCVGWMMGSSCGPLLSGHHLMYPPPHEPTPPSLLCLSTPLGHYLTLT